MIGRRVRWMVIGAIIGQISRRKAQRDMVRATDAIEDRLPAPVARAVAALPGDLTRVGGAVVVAGQGAGKAARSTLVAGRFANRLRSARHELADEIDHERRRMRSEHLRDVHGEAAALDALLDLRRTEPEPIPDIPQPVPAGRRRHRPSPPPAPVARVQRSYRAPPTPWDRPARRG